MKLDGFRENKLWVVIILALFTTACVSTKKAVYFDGINDTTISSNSAVPQSVIQKNDLLSIVVSSLDAKATEVFNTPNISPTSSNFQGYLVGPDGNIQFPILGTIKVSGLTKEQLKEAITKKLIDQKLLTDPIVTIRFINFRVTVLGEVKNPAVLNVPNEKISMLEAIGLAGDLTIYAKRDNVLLIREDESGNKEIKRINLNSTELLSSPYYYLKSNDVIYVEPNKSRVASAGRGQQWLPAVLSGLSVVVIILDRIVK